MKMLPSIIATLCFCFFSFQALPGRDLKSLPAAVPLLGKALPDVLEAAKKGRTKIVILQKWDNPKKKIPYMRTPANYKGTDYIFYYTFDDTLCEDGGNTFGWVTDCSGVKLCNIIDCDLTLESR